MTINDQSFAVKPGDIILVNNHNGNILSKLIRWVTGGNWSHTAVGFFPLKVLPDLEVKQIFEANLLVDATSWVALQNDPDCDVRVYRIRQLDVVTAQDFLARLYVEWNNTAYGWYQLPWFVYRRAIELLRLPRRWALYNWFPKGRVCTGIIYDFLDQVRNWAESTARYEDKLGNSVESPFYFSKMKLADVLNRQMDGYHPQSVHPKDIENWMIWLDTTELADVVYQRFK
jgi:hypothetical protein